MLNRFRVKPWCLVAFTLASCSLNRTEEELSARPIPAALSVVTDEIERVPGVAVIDLEAPAEAPVIWIREIASKSAQSESLTERELFSLDNRGWITSRDRDGLLIRHKPSELARKQLIDETLAALPAASSRDLHETAPPEIDRPTYWLGYRLPQLRVDYFIPMQPAPNLKPEARFLDRLLRDKIDHLLSRAEARIPTKPKRPSREN